MGNVEMSTDLFKEYECSTGTKLLKSIRNNDVTQTEQAIEFARKQLMTPNMKKTHEDDYNFMKLRITQYLTRKYDVGDGMLYKKTPVEFAMTLGSTNVVDFLKDTIIKLSRTEEQGKINADKSPSITAAVGTIDSDRVALAKSRLQALRKKGNP